MKKPPKQRFEERKETEAILFRELVLGFWEFGPKQWLNTGGGFDGFSEPSLNFYRIRQVATREELEQLLPQEESLQIGFQNKFLHLLPVEHHGPKLYPVLHLRGDFTKNPVEVSLQVALFQQLDEGEIKAIGFRLESPGGPSEEGLGDHNFYHIQMIRSFAIHDITTKNAKLLPDLPPEECNKWIPDKEPTFPLLAGDSIELFLCLLVGLYGWNSVESFLNRASWGPGHQKQYRQRMERMRPYRSDVVSTSKNPK